jgi:hypothetical protein
MAAELRLGVDIGQVIIGGSSGTTRGQGGGDTDFFTGGISGILRTPPVDGVFEILPGLVERFAGRVWLISKCSEPTEERTLVWLNHHDFFRRTGIPADHVRFCRARPDKAIHCRELAITDFVDDRLDVLDAVRPVVARRYLFGLQPQPVPPWVVHTPDWPSAAAALHGLLGAHRRLSP